MLSFLQDGLDRRLSPSTLKVYVAAIAVQHDAVDGKLNGKVKSSAPSSGTLMGSPLGPDGLEGGALWAFEVSKA